MSFRSEVKWCAIVALKKPIKHSIVASVFELNARIPSIHDYLSIGFKRDNGYSDFKVSVNDSSLQNYVFNRESCSLIISTEEVSKLAAGPSCKVHIEFTENNAMAKVGDSYLYDIAFDTNSLKTTSLEMIIECPELKSNWQGKIYRFLSAILRFKEVPRAISINKEEIQKSEDYTEYEFYFAPSISPSFKMLFNPKRFDLTSVTLGVIGIIVLEVIAGLIVYAIRG